MNGQKKIEACTRVFQVKFRFPALRRCPRGEFRHGESEFEVQNDEKRAPEVKT